MSFSETGYASTSKNVNILVKPIPNTITSSNVDKYYGDADVWTARLLDRDGNPLIGKTLNFMVCGDNYTRTTDSNGYASVNINFPPRNVTGTVSFNETGYASTSKNVNILVRNRQSTITCSNLNTHINESRDLVATLKGKNNQPIPNKNITFNISGTPYNRTTDSSGRAVYTFPQNPINTNVVVSFRENYYENSSKTINVNIKYWTSSITANNQTAYYGQAIPLTATLKGENNQPLAGKTIRISYNNKNISRTTDSNGNINYSFLENAGNYSVQLRFNENYNTNCTKTVQITVNKMPTSISANNLAYYVNETQNLTAQLKDNNNNPLSNKSLTFNVSGTIYSRTTDSNGYANINIGSNPGNYNVKISFNDANYMTSSKNVNVNVNLLPSDMIVNNVSGHYGENITLSACLKGLNNVSLANKNILISYGNKSVSKTTDANGFIRLSFNEIPGSYNVILAFNDSQYQFLSKDILVNVLNPSVPNVNVSDGFYNSSLIVNVSSDIPVYRVFSSFDNGTTWYAGNDYLSFNLTEGIWSMISYASYDGFNSSLVYNDFIVDYSGPLVWASHGSAIYNESFYVNLTSRDIVDENPIIHYTLDGSQPNLSSPIYDGPILICNNSSLVALRFCSYDCFGHRSDTVCVNYFFGDIIANLNRGEYFTSLQEAIGDVDTQDGDIIEISCDIFENVKINKSVILRSCDFKDILWENENGHAIVFESVIGASVEGFIFINHNALDKPIIVFDNSSECMVFDNMFIANGFASISDRLSSNDPNSHHGFSHNNYILYNNFYGSLSSTINLLNCENYTIIGNIFNKFNESIMEEYETDNHNYFAIYSLNSTNSLFEDNYFSNGTYGAYIIYGENNRFLNNTFYMNNVSLSLNGTDNIVSFNNISHSTYAITINGVSNQLISNIVRYNDYGICSSNSDNMRVNFNSFADNQFYSLYVLNGHVNATNNWWGQIR